MDETELALQFVIDNCIAGTSILDVGCGCGIPVARDLSRKFHVTGIDISKSQIKLAKRNVPGCDFFCCDILEYECNPNSYAAIVSFYTLFHIPKSNHRTIFEKFHNWLEERGVLALTVGRKDEKSYIENDFMGATMYWSNYNLEQYISMAENTGFTVLNDRMTDFGYDERILHTEGESHPVLFARKKPSR